MKKSMLIITFLALVCNISYAKQWSVSNSALAPGQFNSLPAAISSPSVLNGDTLLVHPTGNSYGSFTIDKRLVIIGGGFNTQKTTSNYSVMNFLIFSTMAVISTKFLSVSTRLALLFLI